MGVVKLTAWRNSEGSVVLQKHIASTTDLALCLCYCMLDYLKCSFNDVVKVLIAKTKAIQIKYLTTLVCS